MEKKKHATCLLKSGVAIETYMMIDNPEYVSQLKDQVEKYFKLCKLRKTSDQKENLNRLTATSVVSVESQSADVNCGRYQ